MNRQQLHAAPPPKKNVNTHVVGIILREPQTLHTAPNLLLHVGEQAANKPLELLLVAELAAPRALLIRIGQLLVVDLVARTQIGARIHEQVVRTEAAQRVLAHVLVIEPHRVYSDARSRITILAHQLVEQLGL